MAEPAAILYDLPAKSEYSYSRAKYEKVAHQGVWALQQALYEINPDLGAAFPDGYFGERTEQAVKSYQSRRGLTADGVAGPATQKRIIVGWKNQITGVKENLLDGFCEIEGGWLLAPVNWSVAGGVDVGAVQNRVYDLSGTTSWSLVNGIPTQELLDRVVFDPNKVAIALDAKVTVGNLGADLKRRRDAYFKGTNSVGKVIYPYTKGNDRRSWEMSSLYHNWPYAANLIAGGGQLSEKEAPWVPQSVKDQGVNTYREWADYYVAKVTKYVVW
jgi:peptidoglycan hydrolase-like protein with peptidoglycan-binding domain